MQGLKDLVSMKAVDKTPLPPPINLGIRGRLPPIASNNQPERLSLSSQRIDSSVTTPSVPSNVTEEPRRHEAITSGLPALQPNVVTEPQSSETISTSHAKDAKKPAPVDMFMTSQTGSPGVSTTPSADLNNSKDSQATYQNSNSHSASNGESRNPFLASNPMPSATVIIPSGPDPQQKLRNDIEAKGIRTWPILAILSVFLCNPFCGMAASCITLKAENSYYQRKYLISKNEALVAKAFIIAAFVSGCLTLTGFFIWLIYACTNGGCPQPI